MPEWQAKSVYITDSIETRIESGKEGTLPDK